METLDFVKRLLVLLESDTILRTINTVTTTYYCSINNIIKHHRVVVVDD